MIFKSKPIITQYFGVNKEAYEGFDLQGHDGIDLIPEGTDQRIHHFGYGQVMDAYESTTYGKTVIIYDSAARLAWRFAHLEELYVQDLQVITPGTALGIMGDTGNAFGEHLHLGCAPMVYYGQKRFPDNGYKGRIDPLPLLWDKGVFL